MKIRTNMPETPQIITEFGSFAIGDYVRVLLTDYREYIGYIMKISHNSFEIHNKYYVGNEEIFIDIVNKIKCVPITENFNDIPYFDAEEKAFWKTHHFTKDGLVEK